MQNAIPLMQETAPMSWQGADGAFFADLFSVFKKHNMADRFGLYLIHRHFDVRHDEIMVEINDATSRKSVVSPVSSGSVEPADLIETAWKFDKEGARHVLQYCGRCGRGPAVN